MPTALKLLSGNPGKRPLPANEPTPLVTAPEWPAHLTDDARKEWERLIPLLISNKLISELDTAALALYCQSYGRWAQAERKIAETPGDGLLIKAPSGYPIQNPYLNIAKRAMADCYRYLQLFGLSPSARTSVRTTSPASPAKTNEDPKKKPGRFFT